MDLHDSLQVNDGDDDTDGTGPMDADDAVGRRISHLKQVHQQVFDSVETVRLNMKDQADQRRRVKSELLKPGMKAWLDISGLGYG